MSDTHEVTPGSVKPRTARLAYSVLENIGRKISVVEIQLQTGRLHQIRVQVRRYLNPKPYSKP